MSQNQINHILRGSWGLVYGSLRLTGSAIMHFVQIFTSREKYSCWCNASNELYRMIKNRINRRLSTMKNLMYLTVFDYRFVFTPYVTKIRSVLLSTFIRITIRNIYTVKIPFKLMILRIRIVSIFFRAISPSTFC